MAQRLCVYIYVHMTLHDLMRMGRDDVLRANTTEMSANTDKMYLGTCMCISTHMCVYIFIYCRCGYAYKYRYVCIHTAYACAYMRAYFQILSDHAISQKRTLS